ncbi:unnamed protein product [Malus baccata var. baccata]
MYDLHSGIYDSIGNHDDILTSTFGAKPVSSYLHSTLIDNDPTQWRVGLQIRCDQFFTRLLFEKNVSAKRRVSIFFDNTTNADVNDDIYNMARNFKGAASGEFAAPTSLGLSVKNNLSPPIPLVVTALPVDERNSADRSTTSTWV